MHFLILCEVILTTISNHIGNWLIVFYTGVLRHGPWLRHRGLKLDGAIGQGEICNSLKSENFSKSFLSHIGKNKIKF